MQELYGADVFDPAGLGAEAAGPVGATLDGPGHPDAVATLNPGLPAPDPPPPEERTPATERS